jgi:sugar-specific transcriptional regulator TrmB
LQFENQVITQKQTLTVINIFSWPSHHTYRSLHGPTTTRRTKVRIINSSLEAMEKYWDEKKQATCNRKTAPPILNQDIKRHHNTAKNFMKRAKQTLKIVTPSAYT